VVIVYTPHDGQYILVTAILADRAACDMGKAYEPRLNITACCMNFSRVNAMYLAQQTDVDTVLGSSIFNVSLCVSVRNDGRAHPTV
jgi:hypothetical protein